MQGYAKVNLRELVAAMEPDKLEKLIDDFSCPYNKDVEYFLHVKALEFEKQGLASTYLVFASYQGRMRLAGYFALAAKSFDIDLHAGKKISINLRRRINRFATFYEKLHKSIVTAPLIAQLAKNYADVEAYKIIQFFFNVQWEALKNYANDNDKLITGDELLKIACDTVKEAQLILGGRVVYLECEDTPSLIRFYESNGFTIFGKRDLESVEVDKFKSKYLLQLLKYLKD